MSSINPHQPQTRWRTSGAAESAAAPRRRTARIGAAERRTRAVMVVPPKLKLDSREGVSMMLISATSVTPGELEEGLRAMRAAREDHRGEQEQLLAALAAMGFEYRAAGQAS